MTPPRLSDLLRRANQLFAANYQARDPTASIPQGTILRALLIHGPMTQTQVVEKTGMDRATLGVLLDGLGLNGWSARCRMEGDRRANIVTITPAGRAVLRKADAADHAAEQWILRHMPKQERLLLRRSLDWLVKAGMDG